jgi:hypothetical protein
MDICEVKSDYSSDFSLDQGIFEEKKESKLAVRLSMSLEL